MNESNHTTGPWTVDLILGTKQSSGFADLSAEFDIMGKIYENFDSDGNSRLKSDAHLIAAAPDMLDALYEAYVSLDIVADILNKGGTKQGLVHRSIQVGLKAVREAIAKAEGELNED